MRTQREEVNLEIPGPNEVISGPNTCRRYFYGLYFESFLLRQSVVQKSHSRLGRTKPFRVMPVTRHLWVNIFYAEQLVLG
jgi:hypothetical protein